MSVENDITIFDDYHTVCQTTAISLKDSNSKLNTNFKLDRKTMNAWKEYSSEYEQLKLQENLIDGEWLTERMPSFKTFLQKHDAFNQTKKKFFVDTHSGITAMEQVAPEKISLPMEEMEEEAKQLKLEKIPLEDAFKTPAEEVMENIMKKKNYGTDFEQACYKYTSENNIDLTNMVAFIPTKKALEDKVINEDFIRKHLFPNKNSVIETMKLWKQALQEKNKHYSAHDLFVVSINDERVKVGNIPYIFKDAENYYDSNEEKCYIIKLIGKRHL